jgi:YggT family protein
MFFVIQTLAYTITLYLILLSIRILLSWFPQVSWYKQPFAALQPNY